MSFSSYITVFLFSLIISECHVDTNASQIISKLIVDVGSRRPIPNTFFGAFFEEINHAGTGGLWAELVNNKGFEARGSSVPSNIYPWTIIGEDRSSIIVSTDSSSCFERNKIALRMDILCQRQSCQPGGVGISNPGFWGMNIEQGKKYKIVFYVRSLGPIDLQVSFVGSNDGVKLASTNIKASRLKVAKWSRMETIIEANATNHNSSLQITTSNRGVVWLDQVSAMPLDTYKGHGFRSDLFQMVANLKPKFFRFPGGCFVEGNYLKNAFRWKDIVGPWEERPGHFNDVWGYWTDDGFGFFEGLQLSEDLGAFPVWVFNNGISHNDQVNTTAISPFVQEALDGIEFARGSPTSQWGSLRASMGHPEPFDLRFVGVGNEDCGKYNYLGNYLKFYEAIKRTYPDIQIISNCDGSDQPLNHPADLYDFHIYANSKDMFSKYTKFDNAPRSGPKAFVSEYAVQKEDAGAGSLLAAVAEAAFLIGLEKNSDIVQMVAYAPLFLNTNDRRWIPDAIVFNSYQNYGTPSYWLQQLFIDSSGAILLNSTLHNSSSSIVASAIEYKNSQDGKNYLKVKVVNFGNTIENIGISIHGLNSSVQPFGSSMTVLTSPNIMDENSFSKPNKIVPQGTSLENASKDMNVGLLPYSITSFDLLI
ncbi:unnamed protein product [Trifolium pratense]|uniref:Uncharacterized protein n=1 Tax=Trifolium pratense TaxID=57577 RepID=A0ACB0LXQ4_TRIPR|nr:unnamed protein product [Trifolium pratense]